MTQNPTQHTNDPAHAGTSDNPFDRARALFEAALQALQQGRPDEAETHLLASLQVLPGRASTLVALGATRLRQGRAQEALDPLQQAVEHDRSRSDGWGHLADALLQLGRAADALQALDNADPADPATTWHRAAAHNTLGQHIEALTSLDSLRAQQPQHAPTWLETGRTLQCLGRHAEAGPAYERAVELQPELAQAWSLLGQWHQDQGRHAAAAQALQQALALGHDPGLNRWFLAAAQGGHEAPPRAPAHYVQQLFDGYAPQFDHHLVTVLGYSAPQHMADLLDRSNRWQASETASPVAASGPSRSALDLGCGTGLCGPGLQRCAGPGGVVDGVDLSTAMLRQAQTLNVYRQLIDADVVAHLQTTTARYDVVAAGDLFIYIGALQDLFAGVRRVLQPGGLFVFSVEELAVDEPVAEPGSSSSRTQTVGFHLRTSLRYAHSESYLRQQAQTHGFKVLDTLRGALRLHQGQPVAGLFMLLQQAPACRGLDRAGPAA